jgi:signal peptidase complex subunit 3
VKKSAASSPGQQAPGNISLRNVKPKYQITDLSGFMAGRDNVTLEVGWNVQPWVGALAWTTPAGGKGLSPWWSGVRGGRSKKFRLPDLKGKKTGKTVMEEGAKASPRAAEAKPVLLA